MSTSEVLGKDMTFTLGEWRDYATEPPTEQGVYEWLVPSAECAGMNVIVRCYFRERGAGYTRVLSPLFDHWDGYRVTVPTGTKWRLPTEQTKITWYEQVLLGVENLEFCKCPYCGNHPKLHGTERASGGGVYAGSDAHRFNTWWLECCGWTRTPHHRDPRELEKARRALIAKARGESHESK